MTSPLFKKKEALSKASVLRQLQNLMNNLEQIGFEFVLDFQEECLFLTPKRQYQISSVSIVNTLFVHYLNLSSSYQFMQLFFERERLCFSGYFNEINSFKPLYLPTYPHN